MLDRQDLDTIEQIVKQAVQGAVQQSAQQTAQQVGQQIAEAQVKQAQTQGTASTSTEKEIGKLGFLNAIRSQEMTAVTSASLITSRLLTRLQQCLRTTSHSSRRS